MNRDWVSLHPR